ncbi:hypothetical protein [Haliangium sp.]|uniref:hypothetical protein n=1 Tax=Haliangium sp. TaxID=2663208 RepID=UPI003D14F349
MRTLTARVCNGRLVLDEPTDLPDGTELRLVPEHSDEAEDDELGPDERERLHAELSVSWAQAQAGQTRPADEILVELAKRR